MRPNDGTNSANAITAGRSQPPISKSSPIASAKDMPRIEPIRATSTYGGTPSGMSRPIVATAHAGDNEPVDAAVRVRLEASAVVWQQRRLVLVAGAVVAAASHLFGSPLVAEIAVYGIAVAVAIAEAEVVLARRARTQRQFDLITLVARLALVAVLAVALTLGGAGTWMTLAVLSALVISIAGSVGTVSTVIVVAYTSLVFAATEAAATNGIVGHTHLLGVHESGHMSTLQVLGVALVWFPGLAAVVHLRWRASIATREELEARIDDLRSVRSALESSQAELERLNRDLSLEVSRQTFELELRNRYLSVVNAVSTALAEPGSSEPLVGRAARIAARLLGARAAQSWQSATTTEPAAMFVMLDDEETAELRQLPEELMHQVARQREPLHSEEAIAPNGEPLPDVGGPFVIVPIRSRGASLGAFALIGLDGRDISSRERNLLLSVGRDVGAALDNARHLHDTVDRADRVDFLNDVARLASQRRESREALGAALERVRQRVGARRVSVVATSADGRRETLAEAGSSAAYSRDGRYFARLAGAAAAGRTTIYRRGRDVLPDEVAEQVGTLVLAPITAVVPAVARFADASDGETGAAEQGTPEVEGVDGVVGVLTCSSPEDGVWDDNTVELLDEVAEIVARRLESDAFERIQNRRIDELASLTEVARLMQSGADVERLCGGFAQALRTLLPYRAVTIARASTLGSRAQVHRFDAEGRALPVPARAVDERSLPAIVRPVIWSGDTGDPVSQLLEEPAPAGVALPLLSKGQSLGEVVVGLDAAPEDELLAIVEQAVEQLALALDAATLYQQATSRASQIQTQSNLARIVASQPDLRRAFDEFADEMRWLVPFDRAVLFLVDEAEPDRLRQYATAPTTDEPESARALDAAIVAACAELREPFLLSRDSLPHVSDAEWLTLGGEACEAIVVPVRDERLIALFVLLSESEPRGLPVDTGVLSEVASLLAVTIERVRLFERSEHMARHDQLTGLPNFRYVQEHLAETVARSSESNVTLLMIDMDTLKPFNDLLGHEVGDQVIRLVARELLDRSRGDDFVGRIGGDEFVMVMEGIDATEAVHAASRIHASLADAHLEIDRAPERISVSIGVATCPTDARTVGELLQAADRAMYDAKALGGGRTSLAREGSHRGANPHAIGHAGRLTGVLLRSATSDASEAERSAIALADRYAGLAADHLALDVAALPALRVLVIAGAVARLDQTGRGQEVAVARALLEAVDASKLVDHSVARQVQAIADGAVELAWVLTPELNGAAVSAEAAVRCLEQLLKRPDAGPARTALASIVRSEAAERRAADRVA